jgi:hypothetical protein
MAEIGVTRAGGENERVVGHPVAVIEQHPMTVRIHTGHRSEQGRDLGAITQQIADWPGDLRRRQ